jgi:hypothetical protein
MRPSSAPPKSLSTLNQVHSTPTIPTGISGSPRRKEKSFSPVRELARVTHIPCATVHRRPIKLLAFVRRLLCWVPHLLSDAQKVRCVKLYSSLLPMLEVQEQRAWHDVVTLDESWFYCSTAFNVKNRWSSWSEIPADSIWCALF